MGQESLDVFEDENGKFQDETGSERERLEKKYDDRLVDTPQLKDLVSYVGNKQAPFLSLYRYKEAFSYQLVDLILRNFEDEDLRVFDPFNGMGTTVFTAAVNGVEAHGIDRLPLSPFLTNALTDAVLVDFDEVRATFDGLRDNVDEYPHAEIADDVSIVDKVVPDEQMGKLTRWKSAIDDVDEERTQNVLKLLYLSSLIDCSHAKNAGQFLRIDRDKKIHDPTERLSEKLEEFERSKRFGVPTDDLSYFEKNSATVGDARDLDIDFNPNTVVTSPPYPNRYDYTRSYSLELAFEFVETNDELIELRHDLLRSHIESKVASDRFDDVHPAVREVVDVLEGKELNNNKIPDMLVGYFYDMEKTFSELSRVMAEKARIFLVVDNVRYEGEVVPTDTILADIAEGHGFDLKRLLVTRYKGNSSQQMGKYDKVPVRESVLWLERGTA